MCLGSDADIIGFQHHIIWLTFFSSHFNVFYVLSLKYFLFIVSFSSITWWSVFSSTGNFSNKTQFRNMSSTNYNLIQGLIFFIFATDSEIWKSRNRINGCHKVEKLPIELINLSTKSWGFPWTCWFYTAPAYTNWTSKSSFLWIQITSFYRFENFLYLHWNII